MWYCGYLVAVNVTERVSLRITNKAIFLTLQRINNLTIRRLKNVSKFDSESTSGFRKFRKFYGFKWIFEGFTDCMTSTVKKWPQNFGVQLHKSLFDNECWEILTFGDGLFFQILAHSVFKMWVIQKPNKVALWNKRHFEENKMEIIQHV